MWVPSRRGPIRHPPSLVSKSGFLFLSCFLLPVCFSQFAGLKDLSFWKRDKKDKVQLTKEEKDERKERRQRRRENILKSNEKLSFESESVDKDVDEGLDDSEDVKELVMREERRKRRREKQAADKLKFENDIDEYSDDDIDEDSDDDIDEDSDDSEDVEEYIYDSDPKTRKIEEDLNEYNESEDDKFDEDGGLNIWARAKKGKKLSKAQKARRVLLKKQRIVNAKTLGISYTDYLPYVVEAKNQGCLGVHSMGKKELACISPMIAPKTTTTVATTTTTTTTPAPTTTTTTTTVAPTTTTTTTTTPAPTTTTTPEPVLTIPSEANRETTTIKPFDWTTYPMTEFVATTYPVTVFSTTQYVRNPNAPRKIIPQVPAKQEYSDLCGRTVRIMWKNPKKPRKKARRVARCCFKIKSWNRYPVCRESYASRKKWNEAQDKKYDLAVEARELALNAPDTDMEIAVEAHKNEKLAAEKLQKEMMKSSLAASKAVESVAYDEQDKLRELAEKAQQAQYDMWLFKATSTEAPNTTPFVSTIEQVFTTSEYLTEEVTTTPPPTTTTTTTPEPTTTTTITTTTTTTAPTTTTTTTPEPTTMYTSPQFTTSQGVIMEFQPHTCRENCFGDPNRYDPFTTSTSMDLPESMVNTTRKLRVASRGSYQHIAKLKIIDQRPRVVTLEWTGEGQYTSHEVSIIPHNDRIKREWLKTNRIKINNLTPGQVYWITVLGVRTDGTKTIPVTIKVCTMPENPTHVRVIDFEKNGMVIEWDNPNGKSNKKNSYIMAKYTGVSNAYKHIHSAYVKDKNNQMLLEDIPPGGSFELDMFYVFNNIRSRSLKYRVTRAPKRVQNIAVEKIEIVDEGQANIDLSWAWPEDSYWGSVKIDYSPYTPTGQPSPFYISDRRVQAKIPMESAENRKFPRNSTTIYGLQQGVVYTISVTLTRGPYESAPRYITQGVPTLTPSGSLVEPEELTCHAPLELNPQELKLRKQLVGDPSLTITWERPKRKVPEEGYKVIAVPFADASQHPPKVYFVSSNENKLTLTGDHYDPFLEYSVSVIAKHRESYDHPNPNGPDFVTRKRTGNNYQKGTAGELPEELVAPNACCGSKPYNTETKLCCSDILYDPDPELHRACCGTVIYDMTRYSCCNPMTNPPKVATVSEGCGFEETSGLNGKELKERDEIRKQLVFPVLKSKEHNWEQKIKEAKLKVEREAREKAEKEAEAAEVVRLAEEAVQLRKDKEAEEERRQMAMMRGLQNQKVAEERAEKAAKEKAARLAREEVARKKAEAKAIAKAEREAKMQADRERLADLEAQRLIEKARREAERESNRKAQEEARIKAEAEKLNLETIMDQQAAELKAAEVEAERKKAEKAETLKLELAQLQKDQAARIAAEREAAALLEFQNAIDNKLEEEDIPEYEVEEEEDDRSVKEIVNQQAGNGKGKGKVSKKVRKRRKKMLKKKRKIAQKNKNKKG